MCSGGCDDKGKDLTNEIRVCRSIYIVLFFLANILGLLFEAIVLGCMSYLLLFFFTKLLIFFKKLILLLFG
jgi:hypothetical protein